MTPEGAVTAAWNEVGYERTIEDWMVKGVLEAMQLGSGSAFGVSSAVKRSEVLGGFYDTEGLTLSKRIWGASKNISQVVAGEVKAQLLKNRSWQQSAQDLHDIGRALGDPTKQIADVAKAARRALSGDPAALAKFNRELKSVKTYASRLAANGAPTRHLKTQYMESLERMAKAVEKGNAQAIDKAIERAVWEKARYNQERLVRTEAARAYGDGFNVRMHEDDDVIGFRWELSSRHDVEDICNLNAEADMYGLGPGCYPKEHGPVYPAHQNCLCNLYPLYYGDIAPDIDGGAIEYLDGLSGESRQRMMGIAGAEAYDQDPQGWRSYVRGWQPDESKIPDAETLSMFK
jgi:hypothetical protein